ncbi:MULTISPECIES: hypothetical protein [unclassified Bradyrhizobium]|uniref:hypothetical protein n=1 Tax=unclassified Bradyrhizobium TaxID=2631580 RepID=UPI0028ED268F|nr:MULTISPECIES: hypothetical protein [unclassified Bradyrhizobium]
MRTHLEFVSTAFPPEPGEDKLVNPGLYGKRFAEFLCEQLPHHGFAVVNMKPEDWGWRIDLANSEFPLWLGCGHYQEFENGFLCFIKPSRPFVRRLLKKTSTTDTVDRLARALTEILEQSGKAQHMRWWTEDESDSLIG